MQKFHLGPAHRSALWSERHRVQEELPEDIDPAALPLAMPCTDFKALWHSNPNRTPIVSFWRPVTPAGARAAAAA